MGEICEKLSMKTLVTNCLDGDKDSPCFFNANLGFLVLFGTGASLFAISFIRIKTPGKNKKVNPYYYIVMQTKKLSRKK